VTCSRTALASHFGTTPIAPRLRKYSASFSPKIPRKIKTGGQVPRMLRSSRIAAALNSGGWSPTSMRSNGAVSTSWQASVSSQVTVASVSASSSACCSLIRVSGSASRRSALRRLSMVLLLIDVPPGISRQKSPLKFSARSRSMSVTGRTDPCDQCHATGLLAPKPSYMPRSGFSDSQHRSACLVKIAVRLPLITAYTDAR